MTDLDPMTVALRLAGALDHAQVPYAIGGALAYGLWGDPRGTRDVDLNLFVEAQVLGHALEVLVGAGVSIDVSAALDEARAGGVLIGDYDGMRVDLFAPSIPFVWEAARTRVRLEVRGQGAWYLSAEATAVFKLLFFRSKDRVDIERLVVVQGDALDRSYVRRWMVEMMGEDDERVEAWDRIIAHYG